MEIRDRVVVITGASSGIGHATAVRLAKKGAHLVLAARRENELESVAQECRSHGARCLVVPTDVRDESAVQQLCDRAVREFGHVDVWINDAAVTAFGPFEQIPSDVYRAVIDTNLFGCIHGTRTALRHFRERGRGTLINLGSVVSDMPQPWASAYVVSKQGIQALDRCIRQELKVQGEQDVHVVTVLPSTIDTPLFDNAANYTGRRVVPMPPINDPETVAKAIEGAIRRPRREIHVGRASRTGALMARVLPAQTERTMAGVVDRQHLADMATPQTSGNVLQPGRIPGNVEGGWRHARRDELRGGMPSTRAASVASTALTTGLALGIGALALWSGVRAVQSMQYRSRPHRLPWATALGVAAGLGRRTMRSRRYPWAPARPLPSERRLLPWMRAQDRFPVEAEIVSARY